jgi:hypothetical protein
VRLQRRTFSERLAGFVQFVTRLLEVADDALTELVPGLVGCSLRSRRSSDRLREIANPSENTRF